MIWLANSCKRLLNLLYLVCQNTLDYNQTICRNCPPEFQSNENFVTKPRDRNESLLTKLIVFNYSCTQDCTDEVPCEGLDNHAHFKNFGFSMLTLFRVSTGDNWNGILKVFKFALISSLGVKSLFINWRHLADNYGYQTLLWHWLIDNKTLCHSVLSVIVLAIE